MFMTDSAVIAPYFGIIKKCVAREVAIDAHYKDDIQQEVLLKLYRADAFENFSLDNEDQRNMAVSYIRKTVKRCHIDYLLRNNIIKRLDENEQSAHNERYQRLATAEDIDEHAAFISGNSVEAETAVAANQVLEIIKGCLDGALLSIKNIARASFLKEAFWRQEYDLPLKALAETLGFDNSNPTQDFNRFIAKVDECTSPQGIKLNDANHQVEIITQLATLGGAIV